jgi:hypothetical protein
LTHFQSAGVAAHREVESGRRSGLKAGFLLLILNTGFYWKIVLTSQYSLLLSNEAANQAYAWFNFWVSSVSQGIWPLWDPYTFSGHTFAGEMQTGAFYPPYLPFLAAPLRDGLFSPQAYHVFFVISHAVCAWFVYLLARELGLKFFAGIVSGLCFSLGGIMARFYAWPHMLQSGIWLPLMLLLLIRALKSRGFKTLAYAALSGLSMAMAILAGGLHLVMMDGIVVVSAVVYFTAYYIATMRPESGRRKWMDAALLIAIVCGVGVAGGAAQLLPSAEYSRQAWRWVASGALPATQKIPYAWMSGAIWPRGFFGLFIAPAGNSNDFLNPYMGVLPLLLAAIGIWRRWSSLWVPYLTGLVVAACLYSFGSVSLLHGFLYTLTPLLWMAREADRFMYLANFGLAILAAYGVEALLGPLPASAWAPLSTALKWIAAFAAVALFWPYAVGRTVDPMISLALLIVLMTYGLFRLIIRGRESNARQGWAQILVVALILFDLSAFDSGAANKITEAAAGHDELARLISLRGVANFLRSQPGPFRVQIAAENAPNIGDTFRIPEIWGANVTIQRDYNRLRGRADLFGARYTIRPATVLNPAPVYEDAAWKVYENPGVYPRAWLVHETRVEPDANKILAAMEASSVDARQIALLQTPLRRSLVEPSGAAFEHATLRQSRQDVVDVKVHADVPALLVLSDLFYPGWRATVNGRPADILKVDGGLRGILVSGGDSAVSMHYKPWSFRIGLALSVASFLCAGFLGFRPGGIN